MTQAHDPEEDVRRQEEIQSQSMAAQTATQAAATSAFDNLESAEFLDKLSETQIENRYFSDLQDILGAELSRMHMLANEDEEAFNRHFWLNENSAEEIIHEHNAGRLCKGPLKAVAQGTHRSEKETMTDLSDIQKRQIRAAMGVKTEMQSLAVDNRGLRAVTEATAVTKHEDSRTRDGDDPGRVRRTVNRVLG